MSLSIDTREWRNWVSLAARLVLGVVLIVAGATKVGDLRASVTATAAYQILPYWGIQVVGHALPFAEIALGLLLVSGLFTRLSGALGALLMLAFIIAIASVWVRGISIDCGCFGTGGENSEAFRAYPWEILRDVGLMACGVWLVVVKNRFLAADAWLFRSAEDMMAEADAKRRHR
ncbi:MAG: DoxX family protein [Propionibacteriaceae bacterium]|jgi:uncharacterized membrane protein YphA (DoxX/SURF4 family)|nr:DoxX family protein [Propionibacteriaceae bacterium]